MPKNSWPTRLFVIIVFFLGSVLAGCQSKDSSQIVTIFHAASLSRAFSELEEKVEARYSGLDIRLEPSGSQVAARKISELNQKADLVATADWRIIDQILIPEHANWLIEFTSNEIVLAYGEHSRFTAEITATNWPTVLLRPDVRLGRVDENMAPIGFQTLFAWQLAELYFGDQVAKGLPARLNQLCPSEFVTPDISELVILLESRAIDYAFVFRSIAEEHNLKVIRLPVEYNLSSPQHAKTYARAKVPVILKTGTPAVQITGEPIVYGLTIPKTAP
ncbi:MAG: substrate-binding domain-containing protein, partial [Deltaproteobacteria bacterium]|nr:substrate-binding domain-containing protein [Deltaproteobacteria bacterium]